MQFHAEFFPESFKTRIRLEQPIMLIGSCFTEQIGIKLSDHKFDILQNPHGILFNPVSISKAIDQYIGKRVYGHEDLFYHNDLWHSWDHHSRFSRMNREDTLKEMNTARSAASAFLEKAEWIIITLGSAWVYEWNDQQAGPSVVANCHKIPTDKFTRRLLRSAEVITVLKNTVGKLRSYNSEIKIIFTISPVRHLREGFIENNRSKAALTEAVHTLVDHENILYFPSYELVLDDLRDYRFYAEDLVHPNYAATNYVWEKFVSTCIDEKSRESLKEIAQIRAAVNHKPFNPQSDQHRKFKEAHLQKIAAIESKNPFLDFTKERQFLSV